MKFRSVLFDWDGCLADTLSIWLHAYKQVFNHFEIKVTDRQIVLEAFGDWQAAAKFGISDTNFFNQLLVDKAQKGMEGVALNGDVAWLLQNLQAHGTKIAVATSSTKSLVWPIIQKHHLTDYVDVFLTGEDVVNHKPHPEIVELAIAKLGGNKTSSIIIGDSDKDIKAGKNAGIATLVYYPKANRLIYPLEVVHALGADGIAKDIPELWALLTD